MATTSLPADFPVLWTKIWLKNIRIPSFHWFIPWNSIKSHQNIIKPQWNHQTPIKIPLKTTGFYLIWPSGARLPCGAAASKATSGTDAVEAPRTAALPSSSAFASRPSLLRISSSASFCNGDPIVMRYQYHIISYNIIIKILSIWSISEYEFSMVISSCLRKRFKAGSRSALGHSSKTSGSGYGADPWLG